MVEKEINILLMKRIAFFIIALAISLNINAQDYQKLWKEYNEAIENFLPETARKNLDKIEKKALKDKNDVQLLKTVIKRCEVLAMTAEEPQDTIPGFCKTYLSKLSKASQVILNVEIAKYSNKFDDILSYQDDDFIKTVSMEKYADIFQSEDDQTIFDIELEPTLYDYVMHCLINEYYWNANKQELYEKLLKFDLENNFVKAYYNNRINQLGQISEKNYDDFTQLATECLDNELVAKIKIRQIEYLTYVNVESIKVENAYVKAKQLCEEVLDLLDKNHPLYQQCQEYIHSLTEKNIVVQINNVCMPNQTIPVGLTYRNTSNPSYKIFKVSSNEFRAFQRFDDKDLYKALFTRKAIVENTVKTPVETDYDEHSSLIALPALQNGQYYLVFSNNNGFDNIEELLFTPFQVSRLSYFSLDTGDFMNVYVVDRESGEPMNNVSAKFVKREYKYKSKSFEYSQLGEAVSDKNGFLVAPFEHSFGQFFIDLYDKNDTLIAINQENYSKNTLKDNLSINTYIFTDRAIYRQGQTVHFKGIVIGETRKRSEIMPNHDVMVNFCDPLWQVIDSIKVTSDEFGAFYGSFIIPTDRMRGRYQINTNHIGGAEFKVENYKRPTFEVVFDSPEKEYCIGDSASITGKITALSGFGLDNVKYSYVVKRQTAFPFRMFYFSPYHINDEIIATGENITLNDGSFSLGFLMSPSEYVKVANIPQYTYQVEVTATNKQGETQSGRFSIAATYNKYNISLDIPNQSVDIKDFKDALVKVTNTNGNPVNLQIECKIFKINDNDRYAKDLGNFDRQLLSDQLLKAYFPNFDYYAKEEDYNNPVYQGVIDVDGTARLLQNNMKFSPGRYVVELRAVDDSLSVFSDKYVVFDAKSKKMPYKSMYWTNIDKTSALPEETINYYVGSSEKNVSALVIIKRGKTILKSERILLNNNVIKVSYKVREEDRGRLDFQVALEKYNTEMRYIDYVDVPYNNLELDITLNTLRNKVLPGSEETWSVTIKDFKNKPSEASLMATMYDASLDNFVKHNWYLNTEPHQFSSSKILSDRSFNTIIKYQPVNIARFYYDENNVFSNFSLLPSHFYMRGSRLSDNNNIYYTTKSTILDAVATEYRENESIEESSHDNPPAKIRKDFNETAFFYPDLRTDKNGDVSFTFTMPDALTRWNIKLLAYSKDLKVGQFETTVVTQQPLMIMADMPRFAYDEDTLWIVANVINSTFCAIKPSAKLEVFDDIAQKVESILSDQIVEMDTIPAGQSRSVKWKVAMQKDINLLTFRFSATTDGFSDAEQHEMPVLSTEVYLTQTYSLTAKAHSLKEYDFDINHEGERNHKITLHFNENPLWTAIHAMPYVAEGDEKYAMTAFYRYFVNSMAKQIMESHPEIAEKLENTYKNDTLSELQKYEDLKAIILQETPWVVEAQYEAAQRAAIAKLFDTEEVNNNIKSTHDFLESKQTPNGGWSWIDGCPESVLITQYILTGLGQLGIDGSMTEDAFHFIENEVIEDYDKLDTKKKRNTYHCDWTTMRSLYAMSYFNYKTSWKYDTAKRFFVKKLKKDWKYFGFEERAYIALILNRNGEKKASKKIVQSLREFSIKNELGMYWRDCGLLAETCILEAFNEIDPRMDEIDAMRLWILTQKRTNMWESERASVEAILALVNTGSDWTEDGNVTITVADNNTHAVIDNQSDHVAWGGLYRQYFVPIDKVSQHKDAMKISRNLVTNKEGDLEVGDKVKIEITFENSQDMEFVYLKDLRGACFEPKEQLSEYHWNDGMWYYQSTSDVAMEFYFEYLPKGKHTVSYEVYVTKEGSFSAGYSLIQCQYAPEFGAYSKGSRVSIKQFDLSTIE